ncbi:MAG: hypothetical protein ISP72_02165 [Flavobacteriaceae bacterium]|nr:hypothetical protein [Flavobacteriaceae bacterium]
MNFSFFSILYDTMVTSNYGGTVIVGAQLFAGALFFINIIKKYIKGLGIDQSHTIGLSKKDIFESLGYLLLIFFSSTIIGWFESFLVFFESQFTETVPSVQELTITNTKSLVQQNQDPVAITKRCSN